MTHELLAPDFSWRADRLSPEPLVKSTTLARIAISVFDTGLGAVSVSTTVSVRYGADLGRHLKMALIRTALGEVKVQLHQWSQLREYLLLGLLLNLAACSGDGAHTTRSADSGMTATDVSIAMAGDGPHMDANANAADTVVLNIPLRPKTSEPINPLLIPAEVQVSGDGDRVWTFNQTAKFAVGEGYPEQFEFELSTVRIAGPCGQLSGTAELIDVQGVGEFSTRLEGGTTLVLSNLTEGVYSFRLRGELHPNMRDFAECAGVFVEGATHHLDLNYEVVIQRPTGVRLERAGTCANARPNTAVVSSRIEREARVVLLDGLGDVFGPRNAETGHAAELTLSAPPGAYQEDETRGLNGVRLGEQPGEIVISAEFGDPITYEIIDLDEITDWSPEFQIAAFAGTPVAVESDEEYSLRGRSSNRIVPVMRDLLMTGDGALCTELTPSWFVLESLTPETCIVDDAPPINDLIVSGEFFGHAAKLVADGECHLKLRAPSFAGGQGLSVEVAATFTNVETAHDPSDE